MRSVLLIIIGDNMKKGTKIFILITVITVAILTAIDIQTKGKITSLVGSVNPMNLKSSDVPYTNNSQSTVQGAIDDLYEQANTWINPNNNFGTPHYYAFGEYKGWCSSSDTNCNSYSDFPTTSTSAPSGKNVYAAKYEDGGYGVCIKRNGTPHCFRGRNWAYESQHVQKVFSDISCNVSSSYVNCNASDFFCDVYSNGDVLCFDSGTGAVCDVSDSGYVECVE